MKIISIVKGFTVGLEYSNLDEESNEYLGTEGGTLFVTLSLGFIRFSWVS